MSTREPLHTSRNSEVIVPARLLISLVRYDPNSSDRTRGCLTPELLKANYVSAKGNRAIAARVQHPFSKCQRARRRSLASTRPHLQASHYNPAGSPTLGRPEPTNLRGSGSTNGAQNQGSWILIHSRRVSGKTSSIPRNRISTILPVIHVDPWRDGCAPTAGNDQATSSSSGSSSTSAAYQRALC